MSATTTPIPAGSGATGDIGGTVPATLSLTLGTPATFGAFAVAVNRDYSAAMTANVISTAGNGALSVSDPSSTATGRLVNGTFSLPSPLTALATRRPGLARRPRPSAGRPARRRS